MQCAALATLLFFFFSPLARAQSDPIGLNALLTENPALTGSGVYVAQVESAPSPLQFEVNPGSPGDENKKNFFSYRSTAGLSGTFPNRVGSESGHAGNVAQAFYGVDTGVAPDLLHVAEFETSFFYPHVIVAAVNTRARIVNQSFAFGNYDPQQDQTYDNYIALYHTVIPSGIGDGGAILTPADCYNGIGVAAYGNGSGSSTGPTADGRCKPDITAPAGETSFSTPLVSGAAALLLQGSKQLGINAAAAIDSRTIKALLLSGAVKPSGWSASTTAPLDPNYGAGILNIYNSYNEMVGGRHAPAQNGLEVTTHPPLPAGRTPQASDRGWDMRAITSNDTKDGVAHYLLTASDTGSLITTLAWNKQYRAKQINQLALYVYDANGNQLAASISTVDNVQHIWLQNLSAGTYEIEVTKLAGKLGTPGIHSAAETYALTWDFER